ncbi:MAG TPA: long-chain fatty acid--CoA ligase [Terriglobia bacterium]|jgi:long-chain acyl-CoA synthetase
MLNEDAGILVSDGRTRTSAAISTIPGLLLHSAELHRKSAAFKFKRNGQWIDVSTDEFLLRVEELFFALLSLGLKAGDRVAIISETRLEWAIADYAALAAGAATVPVYPTLSAAEMETLLRDSGPRFIFVSSIALVEKIWPGLPRLPVRHIVAFDPGVYPPGVIPLDTLYEMGRQCRRPGAFRRSALNIDSEQLATIIYTSGTTGVPKGAMLTHRNLVSNILATSERLPLREADISLSFLPLSHIFQRHVDYGCVYAGVTIAYAQSGVTVSDDLREVRPTFAAGVPRFFEKLYGRVFSEVGHSPAVLRMIFERALQIGKEHLQTEQSSLAYRAADRAVFQKIRARLGGRIRFFISGGAALDAHIAEFFWSVGLPIYEGYGLSETSPVITLNGPGCMRIGSVGRVLGDQEVRVSEDGEILVRGSNVMQGYYHLEHETEEALAGGWFHTGDIGKIDPEGYLRITDRKKDLLVTSSGKNVAPQPIENRLKLIPYFENVVVVGDHRNFISALIVPNYEALGAYARVHHIPFDDPAELTHLPEIYELAMKQIQERTQDLAPFEKIKKISFLEQEFSIDGGELTPTLKVRRSAIEKKYQAAINALYAA